jgi:predicted flavoprotein YhiN
MTSDTTHDLVVIGGGPAGMMAAGRASELGKKVILLEKNPTLGVKLLITGGGRSNITNAEYDVRAFLKKYKENDKFLFSTFSQFDVEKTIKFFNAKKMPTKVEALSRVFPESDSAQSVWNVLVEYMKINNVEIKTNAAVAGFEKEGNTITGVKLKNGEIIRGKKYVVATGGTSRPETALVPIALKDSWINTLSGVTLQDIKLTTFQNNQKQQVHKGKLLFTHFGISGPTVLNMSSDVGELLKYGEVEIRLDLLPPLDHGMMNSRLQELFKLDDKKKIKNSLGTFIPSSLVPIILVMANIDENKTNNSVTREERLKLIELIKGVPMQVSNLLGSDKAVVSSGGVDLTEVDFRTMQSKIIENLYLVGDVLNIDRPSGGYSLQLCWTTGWVAGSSGVKG